MVSVTINLLEMSANRLAKSAMHPNNLSGPYHLQHLKSMGILEMIGSLFLNCFFGQVL